MFVRLMADYSSDGVWNESGAMMDRDDLPVSQSLKDDIAAWCRDYETSQFYLGADERTVVFDTASFNARGVELTNRLRSELPTWTVVHRPE